MSLPLETERYDSKIGDGFQLDRKPNREADLPNFGNICLVKMLRGYSQEELP